MDLAEFMQEELIRVKRSLDPSECLQCIDEDEEDESIRICRKSFQDITLHFMTKRKQDHLADILQNSKRPLTFRCL